MGMAPSKGEPPGAALRHANEAGWSDQELLDIAKTRLERLDLGIADCFDASVRLIAKSLNWNERAMLKISQTHYRANGRNANADRTQRHREMLPASTVRLIEEKNALDVQLFRVATAVFQRRLQTTGLDSDARHCELRARHHE